MEDPSQLDLEFAPGVVTGFADWVEHLQWLE